MATSLTERLPKKIIPVALPFVFRLNKQLEILFLFLSYLTLLCH